MKHQSQLTAFLPLVIMIPVAWAVVRDIKKVANKYPPAAPHETKASGVGGWLLVLVSGLIFLGPLAGLVGAGRINTAVTSAELWYPNLLTVAAWDAYKFSTWLVFALVSGLGIYAGIGLLKSCKGRHIPVMQGRNTILVFYMPVAKACRRTMLRHIGGGKSPKQV